MEVLSTAQKIMAKRNGDYEAWVNLLASNDLKPEQSIDETFGIYDGDTLIATASYDENILKCIAIRPDYRGGAVFNELLSSSPTCFSKKGTATSSSTPNPTHRLSPTSDSR